MDPRIRALIGSMLGNINIKDQEVKIVLDTGDEILIFVQYHWFVVKVNGEIVHQEIVT